MDYTKFHIGLYTTLATIIVVALTDNGRGSDVTSLFDCCLLFSLVCFAIAGGFGGLVGSALPHYETFEDFERAELGPWGSKLIRSRVCISLEHTAFWIGVVNAIVGLVASRLATLL